MDGSGSKLAKSKTHIAQTKKLVEPREEYNEDCSEDPGSDS